MISPSIASNIDLHVLLLALCQSPTSSQKRNTLILSSLKCSFCLCATNSKFHLFIFIYIIYICVCVCVSSISLYISLSFYHIYIFIFLAYLYIYIYSSFYLCHFRPFTVISFIFRRQEKGERMLSDREKFSKIAASFQLQP